MTTIQLKPLQNIFDVYDKATDEERLYGMAWYGQAHKDCADIAKATSLRICQVAGVVSALSPGLKWEVNIAAAKSLIVNGTVAGYGVRYGQSIRKAERIIAGHIGGAFSPDTAPKTFHFWRLLVDPANLLAVCVDGHMYNLSRGERCTLDTVPPLSTRQYNRIASDFVVAARRLGILANQLQAICWLTWRRIGEFNRAMPLWDLTKQCALCIL